MIPCYITTTLSPEERGQPARAPGLSTGAGSPVEERIWLVSFLDFDLGYFDEKEGRVEPGPNPFEAKVLTMPSV